MTTDPNTTPPAGTAAPRKATEETRAATDSEIRDILGLVPPPLPGPPPPPESHAESTQRVALDEFAYLPPGQVRGKGSEKTQEFIGPSIRIDGLKASKPFVHLSTEELGRLDEVIQESFEEKGAVLVEKGQPLETLCVLASGKVGAEGAGPEAGEHGRGWCYGTEFLVASVTSPVRIVVLEDCLVLKVRRSALMALLRKEPAIAVKLLWGLLQDASEQLQQLRRQLAERS